MIAEISYVYAGTVRSADRGRGGIFRQMVGDQRWEALTDGLPEGTAVHAITVHPANPEVVFIGTTKGAFRGANRGGRWERLALPDPEADIWSITVDPTDRRTVYAGCGPVGVYRSEDDGDHWKKMPDPGLPDRVHMTFPCRVMRLDVDPTHPDDLYACIEANGTMRSRDRGESWEDCTQDLLRFAEQEKYKSRIVSQTEIEGMLDGHALLQCCGTGHGDSGQPHGSLPQRRSRGALARHRSRPVLTVDLRPRFAGLAA